MTGNESLPHDINIRLMVAPDVLWIGGVVRGAVEHTVYGSLDPGYDGIFSAI